MKKEELELDKAVAAWKIRKEQMPFRDFIITFTMDDGKKFVAVAKEKDEYDIKKK